jgi:hypothetical protein
MPVGEVISQGLFSIAGAFSTVEQMLSVVMVLDCYVCLGKVKVAAMETGSREMSLGAGAGNQWDSLSHDPVSCKYRSWIKRIQFYIPLRTACSAA